MRAFKIEFRCKRVRVLETQKVSLNVKYYTDMVGMQATLAECEEACQIMREQSQVTALTRENDALKGENDAAGATNRALAKFHEERR